MDRGKLALFSCASGREFCDRIYTHLVQRFKEEDKLRSEENERKLVSPATEEVEFPNNEIKTVIHDNIRGDDVYVVQCIDDPISDRSVNDNLMALITALDAANQSDADAVTAVIPQFPYARQERKKGREGITARVIARLLEIMCVRRVITLDIHAEAIGGFFTNALMENLHASTVMRNYFNDIYIKPNGLDKKNAEKGKDHPLTVVAPDVGSADRASFFSKQFETELAIVYKVRDYSRPGTVASMQLVGNVQGKDVFIPDDMISTGGTLLRACRHLKDRGANDIYLCASLPFFNGNAVEEFHKAHEEGAFKLLIGTDAVFWGEDFQKKYPWYHEVSVAQLFANVIFNINQKKSVSKLLK